MSFHTCLYFVNDGLDDTSAAMFNRCEQYLFSFFHHCENIFAKFSLPPCVLFRVEFQRWIT